MIWQCPMHFNLGLRSIICRDVRVFMELRRARLLLWVFTVCLLGLCLSKECRAQGGAASAVEKGDEDTKVNVPGTSSSEAQPRIGPLDPPSRSADHENSLNFGLLKRIAKDQEHDLDISSSSELGGW